MVKHFSLADSSDITPETWFAYLDERLAKGIKPATVNSEFGQLRHFVSFLEEHGRPICSRLLLVDYLDAGRTLPKDVPPEQLRLLQQEIQRESAAENSLKRQMGILDKAWFCLMLHSGLRTCEIRVLRLRDIDWENRRMRIEQSKGLKDRLVYLSPVAAAALRDYLTIRGPEGALPDYLFVFRHKPLSKSYCSCRLRTYGKRAGVQVTPHQLRHSCATLLLNAGAPILTVKMLLGHKHVDTTLGYARLYDGTVAADYFQAMNLIEKQLALPEDQVVLPPNPGELIALVDSLRTGTLNDHQQEVVWQLRAGLMSLAEQQGELVEVPPAGMI
jgi:integrase